jgi:hypothetical protein
MHTYINIYSETEAQGQQDVGHEIGEMIRFVEGQLQLSNSVRRPEVVPPLWQVFACLIGLFLGLI